MNLNSQTNSFLGWSVIFLFSLIPVFLFFVFGNGTNGFESFSSSLYTFGRIFALVGITLFALNFVLSTRLKFLEEVFGGMDKVYLVHGIVGGTAFMLILAHPIFLIVNLIPNHIVQAAGYFIPGGILSLDFGLIAIFGFLSLIFITFFTKMKYNHWKFTHEFMGGVFALASLHILLVRDSVAIDSIFYGYFVFVSIIIVIGMSAFIYSLIVRKKFIKYAPYLIKNMRINKNIIELQLEPESEQIKYQAGQFIFLRFYNKEVSREPHPFSIASKTNDKVIEVIIKKSGDFTNKLEFLKVGDKISIEGPYGKFNFRNFEGKKQIWIAGGIGITPFLGMIDELKENPGSNIVLFYTFKENYIINEELLKKIRSIKSLKFIPWNSEKRGPINIGKIIEIEGNLKDREILICGPPKLKESIIKKLKDLGIKKNKIHEEVFDLK
jgi:predicted ferric reductase